MSITWTSVLWTGDFEQKDHSVEGLTNLLSQYHGKERVEAFLSAFLNQVDSLENLAVEVITKRSLFTAENAQLDALGEIVDYQRGDFSNDEEYRVFLTGKIFVDGADGTKQNFIDLLTVYLGSNIVEVREYWPFVLRVYADNVTYSDPTWRLLKRMCPAGVRIEFVYSSLAEASVFQTADQLGSNETSTTKGTTSLTGTNGGTLGGSYTKSWGEEL